MLLYTPVSAVAWSVPQAERGGDAVSGRCQDEEGKLHLNVPVIKRHSRRWHTTQRGTHRDNTTR